MNESLKNEFMKIDNFPELLEFMKKKKFQNIWEMMLLKKEQ